jgi:hypothetical protein
MPRARVLVVAAVSALAIAASLPAAANAWAPAATATIHPGVQTLTAGGQCTANFIYTDSGGTYIGQAAHCASTGEATDTDGCLAGTLPLGTPVEVTGASRPGTLVYSSWVTMQANGESDPDTCAYNDLALVKIDPADVGKVNPSVPGFGGPTGVGGASAALDDVYSYGNSSLRFGITFLSPKFGKVVSTEGGGWSRTVYTVTPGIPGDSGSGFLTGNGEAVGVLSTLNLAPLPVSNGMTNLAEALRYAADHGFADVELEPGTEPFTPKPAALLPRSLADRG